jgi:hypothetical protein
MKFHHTFAVKPVASIQMDTLLADQQALLMEKANKKTIFIQYGDEIIEGAKIRGARLTFPVVVCEGGILKLECVISWSLVKRIAEGLDDTFTIIYK